MVHRSMCGTIGESQLLWSCCRTSLTEHRPLNCCALVSICVCVEFIQFQLNSEQVGRQKFVTLLRLIATDELVRPSSSLPMTSRWVIHQDMKQLRCIRASVSTTWTHLLLHAESLTYTLALMDLETCRRKSVTTSISSEVSPSLWQQERVRLKVSRSDVFHVRATARSTLKNTVDICVCADMADLCRVHDWHRRPFPYVSGNLWASAWQGQTPCSPLDT